MAKHDVEIVSGGGPIVTRRVEAGAATSIEAGEPVKRGGTGNNYVTLLATGEPTNAAPLYGIAVSDSTDTAAADGTVQIQKVIPGQTILKAKAHTPANVDTDAEALAVELDTVTFDLTGSTFTVNEDEGDDPNVHGIQIESIDTAEGVVYFSLRAYATEQGSST